MGPPEFESESLAPKAKRIGQATLRAQVVPFAYPSFLFKNFYEMEAVSPHVWILISRNQLICLRC